MNFYTYLAKKYAVAHDADDSDVPIENCRAQGGPGNCSVHAPRLMAKLEETDDLEDDDERTSRLAPNGRRSNLTNAQYEMVRSPEFRNWFGQWDKYVLGRATEDECKLRIGEWRRQRTPFLNLRTGRLAELKADWSKIFSSKAKGESASYDAHYASVMALDRLFSNSVLMWRELPRNGSADIDAYAKYGHPFVFDGDLYLAKMTVKEYAKRIGTIDGVYSIEAVSAEKINVTGNNGDISIKGQILDRDVSAIIAQMLKDANGVSKIVDENGEPKVMYHGTAEDFTVFDPEHRKGETASSWFAEKESVAREYTAYGDKTKRVIPVFLNVRSPYDLRDVGFDGGAEVNDARADGGQATPQEIENAARISGLSPWYIRSRFHGSSLWAVTQSPEMADFARQSGHDGILLSEYGELTVGVFNANQIKYAGVTRDDSGNRILIMKRFQAESPDIRY